MQRAISHHFRCMSSFNLQPLNTYFAFFFCLNHQESPQQPRRVISLLSLSRAMVYLRMTKHIWTSCLSPAQLRQFTNCTNLSSPSLFTSRINSGVMPPPYSSTCFLCLFGYRVPRVRLCCIMAWSIRECACVTRQITAAWSCHKEKKNCRVGGSGALGEVAALLGCTNSARHKIWGERFSSVVLKPCIQY